MSNEMSDKQSISGAQCRAARALCGILTQELADGSGVGRATIERLERDEGGRHQSTIDKLVAYFTSRGIRFTAEPGIIGREPERGQEPTP